MLHRVFHHDVYNTAKRIGSNFRWLHDLFAWARTIDGTVGGFRDGYH